MQAARSLRVPAQLQGSSRSSCNSMRPFAAGIAGRRGAPVVARLACYRQQPACSSWAASPLAGAAAATNSSRRSSGRATRLLVRASWGAPVEFSAAKVVSNARVAEQLHKVVLDVGELAGGYTKGGQFMQIKVGDGKPGFFAIASPPEPNNQGLLEFLIKAQGDAAQALAGLGPGAELAVSPVMGKGFPVDRIPAGDHPTVLLFATGSGISPIKALIESGALEADKRGDVRLYYGTRDPAHTAYADAIPGWEKAGVKVIQVYSDDGVSDGDADGASKRYVQDVFGAAKGLEGAPKGGVGVVLCGHKDMVNAVKELVAAEGVAEEKVLLNF